MHGRGYILSGQRAWTEQFAGGGAIGHHQSDMMKRSILDFDETMSEGSEGLLGMSVDLDQRGVLHLLLKK